MNSSSKQWLDAWHVNPSLNKNYDLVDGLRGIAILLVLAAHHLYFDPHSATPIRFIGGILHAGGFGVRLFFALSGFLISLPFWKRKVSGAARVVPTGYGWRRFWKIYPPLALSVIVFTPVYILASHNTGYFRLAAEWLTGLPLILPVSGSLNPVMWSLIVEIHFYILLPLLFLCLKRISPKTCLWILSGILLVVPIAWRGINAANGVYFTLHPEINVHFPSVLDNFAFGVLIAGLESLGMIRRSWARLGDWGFVLLALSLVTQSWLDLHAHFHHYFWLEVPAGMVEIASALLLCYIADPQHPRARVLSQPWLRWCGIISYEWYLIHQPLLIWARAWFGPAHGNLLRYALIVGAPFTMSLLLAAAVYRYFSLPILRRGRSKHVSESLRPPIAALSELQKS